MNSEKRIILYFASSNSNKVEEVRLILSEYPLIIEQINAKGLEIQVDDVEEIAKKSAMQTTQEKKIPVFVEDTGLYIKALEGFPGPYAAYVYKTIGRKGVLKLMDGNLDRRAEFKSAVAFCTTKGEPICFVGNVLGTISQSEKGDRGFGFDSIFIPNEGNGRTFSEMSIQEKTIYSHRSKSIRKFADWYLKSFYNP